MNEDARQAPYDEQVDAAVRGFVQVWNRFEGTLARELTLIQESLEGIRPEKDSHPNANYELFYRVGSVINARGSLTMGELSTALSVPFSTATRIADWLVENSYMQRLPDLGDRRIVRIAFTTRGQELHTTIENHIRQRLQQILSSLSRTEQETLFALLGKVVLALKEAGK